MNPAAFRPMLSRIFLILGVSIGAPAWCAEESADVQPSTGRVTPVFTRMFIAAGRTREHRVIVETTGIVDVKPLDLLFIVDASNSMHRQLDPVRTQAAQMLGTVQAAHSDVRFAVASFSDYFPLHSNDPRDYPWRLDQTFTSDAAQVRAALDRIRILHGGDGPESYARALYEAGQLGWRETARKVVVLFGDSVGHAVDPGRDATPNTEDDLRVESVVRNLAARGVTVVGIYEPKAPAVRDQFEAIAAVTLGHAIALRRGTDAPAAVLAGLARSLQVPPRLIVPAEHREWITEIGPRRSIDIESSEFALTLQVPRDAPSGRRRVKVVATQGTEAATPIGTAEVEIVTGWINDPGIQLGLAVALALVPFAMAWWRALQRQTSSEPYYFNRTYRWLQLAKGIAAFALVTGYVVGVSWIYVRLQEPDTPALSEWLAKAERKIGEL
jgi:hypothetical protein